MLVPLVAEMVMVSPFDPPVALIVGVLSLVMLSVEDVPLSEDATRSTAVGAAGADVSTMTLRDCVVPVFPAASVTVAEMFHVPSESVPSVQLLAEPTV